MPKPVSKIYQQCRLLWMQALDKPIHLAFPSHTEAHRAKFVMYDSVKHLRRTDTAEGRLAEALANVEIIMDKPEGPNGPFGFTIRHREKNPFYEKMLSMIEEQVGTPAPVPIADKKALAPEGDIAAESLRRLMDKLEAQSKATESKPTKPNPYYNREEL